jgi:hypothetical protein
MSGEIVVLSAFGPGLAVAGGLLGAIALGSLVYQEVKARQREQQQQALREAERLQRQLERWQEQQQRQQQEMAQAAQRWQEAGRQLAALRLEAVETVERTGEVRAAGFLQHADQQSGQASRLVELDRLLEGLPAGEGSAAVAGLRASVHQLLAQLDRGPPPLAQAIDSLRQAVERTIAQQQEWLAQEPERQRQGLEEAEQLLRRIAASLPLAQGELADSLSALLQELQQALQAGRIAAADLARLNDGASALIEQCLTRHEDRLVQQMLEERLGHHLRALGYRVLGQDRQASLWAIPGGEQVRAQVQPGLRLAFQLRHERLQSSGRGLDRAEIALLRQQEKRWCADLKGLMERLNADGFGLRVDFEREIPEEAVPIVLVEEVDEILRQTETRYLS